MIEHKSLTTQLLSKTLRKVAIDLEPLAEALRSKPQIYQADDIEESIIFLLKLAAKETLLENQQATNDFGLVHTMNPELKAFIFGLAANDEYAEWYRDNAENSWNAKFMRIDTADEYFPNNKKGFFQNAIVFDYLINATLDSALLYLFPDWPTKISEIEQGSPENKQVELHLAHAVNPFFKGTDTEDSHLICTQSRRTLH